MEAVRDFTDDVRAELKSVLSQQYQVAIGTAQSDDELRLSPELQAKLLVVNGDVAAWYNQVNEWYNTAYKRVDLIFDAVYEVETSFTTTIANAQATVDEFTASLVTLTGLLRTTGGGDPPIALPSADFASLLSPATASQVDAVKDQIMIVDDQGNTVPDWTAIEAILGKNAEDISQIEYQVLAQLYAGFLATQPPWSTADVEHFLESLADPVGDPLADIPGLESPACSTWGYDQQKIANLTGYLSAIMSQVALERALIEQLGPFADAATIASLYQQYIGGTQSDPATQKTQLGLYFDEMTATVAQKSGLLSVLGDSLWLDQAGVGGGAVQHPALIGAVGGSGPDLTLADRRGEDGLFDGTYDLTVTDRVQYPDSGGYPVSGGEVVNVDHAFNVSRGFASESLLDAAEGVADRYYTTQYSATDPSWMMSVALIAPLPGGVVLSAAEVATSAASNIIQNQQSLSAWKAFHDSFHLSTYCGRMNLSAVVISDGGGAAHLVISPTASTALAVQRLNQVIKASWSADDPDNPPVYPGGFGLGWPITVDAVLDHPELVNGLMDHLSDEALAWIEAV